MPEKDRGDQDLTQFASNVTEKKDNDPTQFQRYSFNDKTQFASMGVDSGDRRYSILFSTDDGLTIKEIDRRSDDTLMVKEFETDGKPSAGFLILASKATHKLSIVPLDEYEISHGKEKSDIFIAAAHINKAVEDVGKDAEPYVIVTMNPDTQSFSAFYVKDSDLGVDIHPGDYIDRDTKGVKLELDASMKAIDDSALPVSKKEARKKKQRHSSLPSNSQESKHSPQEQAVIKKRYELGRKGDKGTQRQDHHGFVSDYDSWSKVITNEARKKNGKFILEQDAADVLDYPELLEPPVDIQYVGKYSVPVSRRLENEKIDEPRPLKNSGPLVSSERRAIAKERKLRYFGRERR